MHLMYVIYIFMVCILNEISERFKTYTNKQTIFAYLFIYLLVKPAASRA